MGKLILLDLIVYILRCVWCMTEPLLELSWCMLAATYDELSSIQLSTQIVICLLLMGIAMMFISPFHPQMDPRLYPGPFEIETYQVHKPAIDNNEEWNKMYLDRIENILEGKKEKIHFIVRLKSNTKGSKSIETNEPQLKEKSAEATTLQDPPIMEKISKDSLPRVHVIDRVEQIEKELLVVEPVEED